MDIRPVYQSRSKPRSFDNALYYYARFNGNCPICLSYHESPCIIPCGHTFCACCLAALSEFTRNCPVCAAFYWASRPVRFFLLEHISDTILFVRLRLSALQAHSASEFFECPYQFAYYKTEEPQEAAAPHVALVPGHGAQTCGAADTQDHTYYQSADGQLYFLNPKTVRAWKSLPEFIYGTIKSMFSCRSSDCRYRELGHIPPEYQIHIVAIEA